MTEKERLNRTLSFQPVDRPPLFEIALWEQTVEAWKNQGLPEEAADANLLSGNGYFGLEGYDVAGFNLTFPEPCPDEVQVAEDDRHVTFVDGMGRTRVALKEGSIRGMRMSMDCYVDFPVKNRDDFLRIRDKYLLNRQDRIPVDWPKILSRLGRSSRPSTLLDRHFGSFGYYSMLRDWMGTEGLSYMLYDDPDLVHECLEFLTTHITGEWLARPLREARFDLFYIHEDMAGRNGPLLSPGMFREFLLPHYRRFVEFLKGCGVSNVVVDTDGEFEMLIPAFLEAGVEGFGPVERAAGMDPVSLREKYGKAFFMIGGIDKRVLCDGEQAVRRELQRIVPPLLRDGGFIPTIDHSIPPDVPLRSFLKYLELKRETISGG